MACAKDHSGEIPKAIEVLQDSQAGFWRHKCAGCAYEMGKRDGETAAGNLREQVRKLRDENDRLKAEVAKLKRG